MRIISLAPSITETIFALGAGKSLVGVTEHCNFPEKVNEITSVGAFASPSVEEMIKLKPDVLITTTFHKPEKLEQITATGVELYRISGDKLFDAPDMIEAVGKAIGKEVEAQEMADEIRNEFNSIIEEATTLEKVMVCYLCTSTKFCGHKPQCHTNSLVEKLGGKLTAYDKANLADSIVDSLPETIIIPYSEDTVDYNIQRTFFDNNEVFKQTPAYINGRVHNMNGELLSRPGPRAAEGLRQLFELIHN